MLSFEDYLKENDPKLYEAKKKKWIQKAIDPEHKGDCTPMTKKTCTPRKKALALRFKKGDIHKANIKKGDNPKGKG
jgi:hypothetical protein